MPQRKQLTWSDLRVGMLVLVGTFLVAVGIFYVTGTGILAAKYRLRTFLPEVEGLNVGAPVRLDGVAIGNVDSIRMAARQAGVAFDRQRSVEVMLRIDNRFQEEIRTDSTASLITEGLLGNRYVTIKRGSTGMPLPADGEVRGEEEASTKAIVERGAELVQNLNALSKQTREIVDAVERGRGTLGKLLTDESAYNRLNSTLGRLEQMTADTQAGKGTLGKLFATEELYAKVNSAAGRFDTLLADVQAQKGALGKFVYDPSAYDNVKQFAERGNAFLGDVRAGKGALGKLATDDSLYTKWHNVGANLESATAKLDQGQGTAAKFFTDPQFYDNLTGLSGDLRLLIGEFRQNPKKFLRVKFSIF